MSKPLFGSHDYNTLDYRGRTAFGFVDVDNIRMGFHQALSARGLNSDEVSCFNLTTLLRKAQLDRYYFYSAVEEGIPTPSWINEMRALPNFVFREANLTTRGRVRKQEGVDVRLAVEAMQCAHRRTMSACTIFSCDGDLLPLVKALIDEGIFTAVACFNDPLQSDVSSRLRDAADTYVHIGSNILSHCLSDQHMLCESGAGDPARWIGFKSTLSFQAPEGKWELRESEDERACVFHRNTADNRSAYFLFKSTLGARSWLKLRTGNAVGS